MRILTQSGIIFMHRPLVGIMRLMLTKNATETVRVDYLKLKIEMDIKLKMESSDSAKEPSRRGPFVLGLSGQNYNFSSG